MDRELLNAKLRDFINASTGLCRISARRCEWSDDGRDFVDTMPSDHWLARFVEDRCEGIFGITAHPTKENYFDIVFYDLAERSIDVGVFEYISPGEWRFVARPAPPI